MRRGQYTIPSGSQFLTHLAQGILNLVAEQGADNPLFLSQMRILLPTRRAGRELRDAFLKLSNGRPLLLPSIQSIGDVDSDEIDFTAIGYGLEAHDIPPAITKLERQFLLSTLIAKKDSSLGVDACLALANHLARLIDTVHTEDLEFSALHNIVPQHLAEYWLRTLDFLSIVTSAWPLILAERGQIDPSDRRNRLMKKLASLWEVQRPVTPIIAAGSTGSIPSAARLLSVISQLPQGAVILPGLDLELDEASWNLITDTHPQATIKNLLGTMGITRDTVKIWPESEGAELENDQDKSRESSRHVWRAVMKPADSFGDVDKNHLLSGMQNLSVIEAQNSREEAGVIALILREVLEHPTKTACLITPDRNLARRVQTALSRWGVEVDDSAGGALATTQGATFLSSILQCVADDLAPLSLLDCLKHAYQNSIPPEAIDQLERYILRGARPAPKFEGLRHRLSRLDTKLDFIKADILRTIEQLESASRPLTAISKDTRPLADFVTALVMMAESLSQGEIWSKPESQALSQFLKYVIGYSDYLPDMSLTSAIAVMRELVSNENYRPLESPYRRILFLGQLESRLIKRDVMILAGLNEGVWPRDPGFDPWMSRPMKKNFGLPSVDRGVGLAAHDVVQHAIADEVYITRSLKADGTATVPARWLERLKTLCLSHDIAWNSLTKPKFVSWFRMMDEPSQSVPLTCSAPTPCPDLSFRPEQLSATTIEKWMRNPYRIYAERILKLNYLEPLEKNTVASDRGNLVHECLHKFVKAYPHQLPADAREQLYKIADDAINQLEYKPAHWEYWRPRLTRILDAFLENEIERRRESLPWVQEERGSYLIYNNEATKRKFTITAKADRIDRLKTGGAVVLDYKTGKPPSQKDMKNGKAAQLPLEALILQHGGYCNTPMKAESLEFLKLTGGYTSPLEVHKNKTLNIDDVVEQTEQGMIDLVTLFENPNTPYIALPPHEDRLFDEDRAFYHLARLEEWSHGEDDEGDEDKDEENAA